MTGEIKELVHSLVITRHQGSIQIIMKNDVKTIADLQLNTEMLI
jgi:hypothetical protein